MNATQEAFEDALDGQEDALGHREAVNIEGKSHEILLSQQTLDMIPVGGGDAEAGGYSGSLRRSEFPAGSELKGMEITRGNETLTILSTAIVNDTIEITVGDPSAEE